MMAIPMMRAEYVVFIVWIVEDKYRNCRDQNSYMNSIVKSEVKSITIKIIHIFAFIMKLYMIVPILSYYYVRS